MLLAILLILLQTGTTDLQILLTTEFSERHQIFLWIASFASFAVKVPMVPVHIWLPHFLSYFPLIFVHPLQN